tara:strand:+ start:84 stop:395 length:312 start_codon:yes stop_codon:yes gene_type:complete
MANINIKIIPKNIDKTKELETISLTLYFLLPTKYTLADSSPKLPKERIRPDTKRIKEYIPFPSGPNTLEIIIKPKNPRTKRPISVKNVIMLFLKNPLIVQVLV